MRLLAFVIMVSALVGALLPATGCGGKKPQATREERPQLTEEEIEQQRLEKRIARLNQQFRELDRLRKQEPLNFGRHLDEVERIRTGASGTPLIARVEKVQAEIEQAREAYTAEQVQKLKEAAASDISEGNYEQVLDLCFEFQQNEALLGITDAWSEFVEFERKMQTFSRAERDARKALLRAGQYKDQLEYATAIGILIAFPDRYQGTPYYEEVQERIDEYMPLYLTEKKKRDEILDIKFEELEIDEALTLFETFNEDEKVVWKGVEGVVEGDNDNEKASVIMIGDRNWSDFILECSLKYKGETLKMGIGAGKRYGRGRLTFAPYNFPDFPEDEWVKLRITVNEGRIEYLDRETREQIKRPSGKDFETGGLAIFCFPGQKIWIKDVQAKIINKVAEKKEGADASSDDSDKSSDK